MHTTPTTPGWYTHGDDPDLRIYWTGSHWSPPVHVYDLDRFGASARKRYGETQHPEMQWRPCELDRADAVPRAGNRCVAR